MHVDGQDSSVSSPQSGRVDELLLTGGTTAQVDRWVSLLNLERGTSSLVVVGWASSTLPGADDRLPTALVTWVHTMGH